MLKDALSRMADVFLPTVLMRGQEYQQKGHVLNIRLSDGLLKARVKGHSSQIYDVHIDLKTWPKNAAHCSCPYRLDCKHAAAALFSLQVRENVSIPAPSQEKTNQSLDSWLADLREKTTSKIVKDSSYQILYFLSPVFQGYEHRISIQLAMAKRLKKGGFGKKALFNSVTDSRRRYFSPADDQIIPALMEKNNVQFWFEKLVIRNSELLEEILKTDRAYLDGREGIKLNLGESLDAALTWELNQDSKQYPKLKADGEEVLPLFLDKVWYFDEDEHRLGLLKFPYALSHLKKTLDMEPVALEKVSAVAKEMELNQPDIPLPTIFKEKQTRAIKPHTLIRFDAMELAEEPSHPSRMNQHFLFVADVLFSYDDRLINSKDPHKILWKAENHCLIEMARDLIFEKTVLGEIEQILSLRSPTVAEKLWCNYDISEERILTHVQTEDDLPRLYNQLIPALEKKGWQVEFAHPVYEEIVNADEVEWYSNIEESGHDFFSYELGILVEGKPVSIVPLVAELLGKIDRQKIEELSDQVQVKIPLPGGKTLRIGLGRLKPLIRFLLQYGTRHFKHQNDLRISRYQLLLMRETELALAAASARWQASERIGQQLKQLGHLKSLPEVEMPRGLNAVLRDYQREGLNWLQFLRKSHFGAVLADDMGLGKTVQTLAHLQVEKEQGRVNRANLIVAPTSLVLNWFEEARRFTPKLKVLVFHGASRHADEFDDYDLVVSTYGLIQRDKSRFLDYSFYYLILDESQSIKNARTKTTQIIQQIKAEHRLCLSGTPLENHLGELWSLFHFLMPGLLGDAKQFRQFFKNPIEKEGDLERRQLLAKRVQPFILRRTKNQVAQELPAKTEMTRTIELSGSQRDLYEAIRMSMERKIREAIAKQGMEKSHILLLDALLKLRQVCCDPKLLSMPEAEMAYGNSAKLKALLELLDSLLEEGRRVLIFSQFTSMLKLIEEELKGRNYEYLKLTGQTQNRQALVNRFQEGTTPIFLISLKAGGTGLNLTRADTVIHYDPWWNPAVEDQATDRSHRIGQENPVFVYKLITAGTVEEAILAMQNKKRELFEGILSDNRDAMINLSTKDIEQFFAPLPNH
ncbi:DEAD/DEAH box helicase [Legionella jordanis]|uniref:SNF2/RAD54 family transporter domain-containing protein n=1 Tax=Legionella jordanis TaxID=456 RepID=A0A0W0VFQ3_9GAMM|nr:DEAD/DEAH box helicase [Legionella jordanis]KTD18997.1 SNF2/RAD54 family transporter domain-containing protein [Legionella jordanis]RMX05442.1 helicase [Legionella jordanis]VEH13099.1 DNA helicase, SNF2/RAD54 family domain protein [Legionella jordanis]